MLHFKSDISATTPEKKQQQSVYAKTKVQINCAKTKVQISCAVTAQLISPFVFAT